MNNKLVFVRFLASSGFTLPGCDSALVGSWLVVVVVVVVTLVVVTVVVLIIVVAALPVVVNVV
jgi:hypothetical protein